MAEVILRDRSPLAVVIPSGPTGSKGDPGGNVMAIGLFTSAPALTIPAGADLVRTNGYSVAGKGVADYIYDAAVDAAYVTANPRTSFVSANGRGYRLITETGIIDATALGALGAGAETLSATSYSTDLSTAPTTITQQTNDGHALNTALKILRALGGGVLKLPKGDFKTYGYLERVDFPLHVQGAGKGVTRIRNCSTSPWANGYGIFVVQPTSLSDVSFADLTLDGNAAARTKVVGEFRAYPLAVYGLPKLALRNMESINSPIDCLMTFYTNGEVGASVQAVNCLFSSSFRNTVSLVGGWNQQYTNCRIEKGGSVQGGQPPKAALDIEPNLATACIANITFTNCTIREAAGTALLAGVWAGNVKFVGCTLDAFGGTAGSGAVSSTPWVYNLRGGEFTFTACTLKYTGGDFLGTLRNTNPPGTGDYATTEFVALNDCDVEGAGLEGFGLNNILNNVRFKNSLHPVYFGGTSTQNIFIDGLRLFNVFDPTFINIGGGVYSSFNIAASFEGVANISNVDIRVRPNEIPSALVTALTPTTQAFGVNLTATATGKAKLSNIHADGFYRKLPTLIGAALNTSNFRDWRAPTLPPADTAGQITNASLFFYRNCTMYGDAA